jgi:Ca-activated chloride channel homolog
MVFRCGMAITCIGVDFMKKTILISLLLVLPLHATDAATKISKLLAQQADQPENPIINYNLGVAQYQQGKFQAAEDNFERAIQFAKNKKDLERQSAFNAANAAVKGAQSLLPADWQTPKVSVKQELLQQAHDKVAAAIKRYSTLLSQKADDQRAATNKKKAEALLEQIKQKMQQPPPPPQDNDQNKDKKNDDKKDQQNQDNKDDKKDGQGGQDKKNNDQSDKKDQSSSDKNNQGGQGDNKKDSADSGAQHDDKVGNTERNNNENKPESDGNKDGKSADNHGDQGDKDPLDGDDKGDEKKNDLEHKAPGKASDEQTDNDASQPTGTGEQKQESMEARTMRAILENLQADEAKAHKKLFMYKANSERKPLAPGQKPW